MTTSAIGCRGWGSGRAGRIRTLPGASRAPRSPTPPSQLAPHTSPPPAPRRERVRREAKLEDDGCSVTISNANVRSERERIPARSTSSLRRVVPTRGARATRSNTGVRRGERCLDASWSRTLDPRAPLDSIAAGGGATV